jgi:anti-sigma regulatory factor (Ser/Thr protein kinase)
MTGWAMRQPPGIDEQIARWTLDQPPQLHTLRAALQRAVMARAQPVVVGVDDLTERLVIVATELAGNALRHARPPTVVALLRADGHLIVEVVDRDVDTAPAVAEHRPPGAGGLGLQVARRLAEDVGWYLTDSGKHVWAQFTMHPN